MQTPTMRMMPYVISKEHTDIDHQFIDQDQQDLHTVRLGEQHLPSLA